MILDCKHKQADEMEDYYFLGQSMFDQVTFGVCNFV